MKETIVKFLVAAITWSITSIVLYFTYNSIAWEFNWPTFHIWTAYGVVYVIKMLRKKA